MTDSADPMDAPPKDDFGSDRFDYIEVDAPDGMDPPQEVLDAALRGCPDCRANVFIRWYAGSWWTTWAHDDGCPVLERLG